ncbi:MAG: AAA family ATPase [Chloroflexota bacterium]
MAVICSNCGAWERPKVDLIAQTAQCAECAYLEERRYLPLFIVTGASGTGKTTIVPELQKRLPEWAVFETDILHDSGNDWQMIKCNWLRIAHSLAQSNRPVLLCGTITPENILDCDHRPFFSSIHFLALHCEPEALAERLRNRPAWRGWNEDNIREHQQFDQWLIDNAKTAFNPPLSIVDTTNVSIQDVADQVCQWATTRTTHDFNR